VEFRISTGAEDDEVAVATLAISVNIVVDLRVSVLAVLSDGSYTSSVTVDMTVLSRLPSLHVNVAVVITSCVSVAGDAEAMMPSVVSAAFTEATEASPGREVWDAPAIFPVASVDSAVVVEELGSKVDEAATASVAAPAAAAATRGTKKRLYMKSRESEFMPPQD
jgi:hypothetical protein